MKQKNDIVKKIKTKIDKKKIKISFKKDGVGYDGCGSHTHKD